MDKDINITPRKKNISWKIIQLKNANSQILEKAYQRLRGENNSINQICGHTDHSNHANHTTST